jgi:hypothetical protein
VQHKVLSKFENQVLLMYYLYGSITELTANKSSSCGLLQDLRKLLPARNIRVLLGLHDNNLLPLRMRCKFIYNSMVILPSNVLQTQTLEPRLLSVATN